MHFLIKKTITLRFKMKQMKTQINDSLYLRGVEIWQLVKEEEEILSQTFFCRD